MSQVLVDTSVWRHHFAGKPGARALGPMLDDIDAVAVHPGVIGELVLGGLAVREERLLERLPSLRVVADEEVLDFVRRRGLARRGIGWIDCHLLASALVAGARLWSLDRGLSAAAEALGVSFSPAVLH